MMRQDPQRYPESCNSKCSSWPLLTSKLGRPFRPVKLTANDSFCWSRSAYTRIDIISRKWVHRLHVYTHCRPWKMTGTFRSLCNTWTTTSSLKSCLNFLQKVDEARSNILRELTLFSSFTSYLIWLMDNTLKAHYQLDAVAFMPGWISGRKCDRWRIRRKLRGFCSNWNVIGQSIRRYFNSKKSKS